MIIPFFKKEDIFYNMKKMDYMKKGIENAKEGIHAGHGGPFGSVIVRNDTIVGSGHNMVLKNNDPTAHGEINAIRSACKELNTFDLSDCELYTTGEPCPMCLAACMWANIKRVYYGCTISDNEKIGFRDAQFDKMMGGRENIGDYLEQVGREECLVLFNEYNLMDKTIY